MYSIPFVHGLALANSRGQVVYSQGELDKVFPLMSVTKPLAAYTILLVVQQGKLSLDTPLESLRAAPSGSGVLTGISSGVFAAGLSTTTRAISGPNVQRITLRHLLSHASGLGYESGVQCAPETKRIYSNQGIELAADLAVQATQAQPDGIDHDATTETFANLTQKLLFQPLCMKNTEILQSAAYSGVSTVSDLLKFAAELATPTMLRPDLYQRMIRPVFSQLRGTLPGYGMQNPCEFGLGMEIRGSKNPHWLPAEMPPESFGHFGVSGSFLWVVPKDLDHPLAGWRAAFLGDQDFGTWHIENWPKLQTYMLEAAGITMDSRG